MVVRCGRRGKLQQWNAADNTPIFEHEQTIHESLLPPKLSQLYQALARPARRLYVKELKNWCPQAADCQIAHVYRRSRVVAVLLCRQ